MFYSIDLPNPLDPESEMIEYGTYETRELAVKAAHHHFGADEDGRLLLVTGPHDGEPNEEDDE